MSSGPHDDDEDVREEEVLQSFSEFTDHHPGVAGEIIEGARHVSGAVVGAIGAGFQQAKAVIGAALTPGERPRKLPPEQQQPPLFEEQRAQQQQQRQRGIGSPGLGRQIAPVLTGSPRARPREAQTPPTQSRTGIEPSRRKSFS